MATVDYTLGFASDAQGLVDNGTHASVTFAFEGSDGNPSGCVKFTCAQKSLTNAQEYGIRASGNGLTWEQMGVPAGATVTNVELVSWQERLVSNSKLSSHSLYVAIVEGSSGTAIAPALLQTTALGTAVDSAWQSNGSGGLQSVGASYQASSTPVRVYLLYTITTLGGGGSANVDQRFDNLVVRITYTPASTADADAEVAWAELEVPSLNASAEVAWSELEVPTANSQAEVAWSEVEVPTANAAAEISFSEFEVPSFVADSDAEISWSEFEVPTASSQAEIAWAEFETPFASAQAEISWAEFEAPLQNAQAEVSWSEFEIPFLNAGADISWAELEVPIASSQAEISWAEFETPFANAESDIAFVELEVPSLAVSSGAPARTKVGVGL